MRFLARRRGTGFPEPPGKDPGDIRGEKPHPPDGSLSTSELDD